MPVSPEDSIPSVRGKDLIIASPLTISEAAFSVPSVRSLRPILGKGTISVAATAETAPMWRMLKEVDEILEYQESASSRRIVKMLERSSAWFDLSLSWENTPIIRAFERYKIPERVGLPDGEAQKHLTHPLPVKVKSGQIEHRVQDYLEMAARLGANPYRPCHFSPPDRPAPSDPSTVAICPGSDFGSAAEWPVDNFREVAKEVLRDHRLVVLSAPNRHGPANTLANSLSLPVMHLEGEELLECLSTSQALISSDGSIPHLASFVGTPSVVIFGPNQPDWHRPLGKIHRVLHKHVACSGCLLNKCPLDHRCMKELPVDQVLDAYRNLAMPSA
jgi:heptosyltransferase-2